MKRILTPLVLLLASLTMQAQYDIIPLPSNISIDTKGRMLTIDEATPINDKLNPKIENAEGWRITVDKLGITIEGSTDAGIFYGHQALRQIMARQPKELPYAVVENAPRFAYRGMHLDICRHIFPKDVVKNYIDIMALHDMNTLHWHLSDDQGWRIEIKKWPRLTQVGGWRDRTVIGRNLGIYDHTMYGGFYTQKDIREIVQYAAERHITIIPEIDMPGHMVAAVTAYPELGCTGGPYEVACEYGVLDDVLCAGRGETLQFAYDVLDEVMDIFPCRYVHLGGDECPKVRWEACRICQEKIRSLGLKEQGAKTAGELLQSWFMDQVSAHLEANRRRAKAAYARRRAGRLHPRTPSLPDGCDPYRPKSRWKRGMMPFSALAATFTSAPATATNSPATLI